MRTGRDVRRQRLILGKAAATPRHQVRAHPVFASALSQLTCTRACFGCAQSCLVAACGTRAAVQELKLCTCHIPSPLPAHDRGHREPSTCAHPAALLLRAVCRLLRAAARWYLRRRTHAGPTKLTHPCARDRPTPDANAFSRQFYTRTSRSGALNRCAPRSMSLGRVPIKHQDACRDSRHFALENAFIE